MRRVADTSLAAGFKKIIAVRRLFGPPHLEAAQRDPATARREQARLISATGGVTIAEPPPTPGAHLIAPRSPKPDANPILYLHGGGLVFYDSRIYAPWLRLLADNSGRTVVAIDYPKAPETPPQRIVEFILDAARPYIGPRPAVLAGDSIGATLALWLTLEKLRPVEKLLLIAPVLNFDQKRTFSSYDTYGSGFALDRSFMDWFRALAAEALPGFDPAAATAKGLAGLPPTSLIIPACDLLSDEARSFASRNPGMQTCELEGLPHDFRLYPELAVVQDAARLVASGCG